jgi:hypothetical protein
VTFRLGQVARLSPWIRACARKGRFATKAGALAQAESLYLARKAVPGSLNVYRCPFCGGGWHVGHPKYAAAS